MKPIVRRLVGQMVIAVILALLLSSWTSIPASSSVTGALYTVVGVASSLSISMAISIDLKEVREPRYRSKLKKDIRTLLDSLVCDFSIASFALLASITNESFTITLSGISLSLSISLLSSIIIALSHVYNLRNIYAIYKFKADLEERIISEGEKRKG
ncbi:hypothetical protein [Porphyromonas sp. oral taxon 279]|jgi:hypothetical protein|uniref:hypothetical protein n=1 Tax=Porphyromonas sp. oral taxon 279 TaxID=712438 RepID=UPI0012EAED57|nr:hypothetical protein [Porphyromonas sp. oral taxon 279]